MAVLGPVIHSNFEKASLKIKAGYETHIVYNRGAKPVCACFFVKPFCLLFGVLLINHY